jgi:DMSO/TMAO reductase YedYZ molybdopterin-dependent catalytic subunit
MRLKDLKRPFKAGNFWVSYLACGFTTVTVPMMRSKRLSLLPRRDLLYIAGSFLTSHKSLFAEHHTVSADPLLVEFDVASLTTRYTSAEDFFVRNHNTFRPEGQPQALTVQGLVERPMTLTIDDLHHLRQRAVGAVLECSGNMVGTGGLSNGYWEGWPLSGILAWARPKPDSAHVHFYGKDGFARSVPIGRANEDGLLVTRLNGRPLRHNNGYPWRVLMLGWYGMDSVKWLERIDLATSPLVTNAEAYVELRGQPSGEVLRKPLPRVAVKSIITIPREGAAVPLGTCEVTGLAWSGGAKVTRVEVSKDGGAIWEPASLEGGTQYEWTKWRWRTELRSRGTIELNCRATDEKGTLQPERRDPKRMDGYVNNWYHRVRCRVY